MQTATNTADGWIEIFRAGDFTAKGKGVVTREDLQRIATSYKPDFHEAPVTVGHPADNLPAYGWIGQLQVDGDVLLAKETQVDPKFNELRQAGRFKKRSASFYTDADGKATYLRHVAWLGAQPPEVKGLRDVKFSDEGKQFTEFEEVAVEKPMGEQIKDAVSEFFAGLTGKGAQPKTFSEADVTRIATEAATAASTAANAQMQAKVTEMEAKLTQQAKDFAERETKLAGGEVKQRADAAIAKLKSAGKWVPAFDKAGVPLLFAEVAKVSGTVEFGEGTEKKTLSPFELLVAFAELTTRIVPNGRVVELPARSGGKPSTGDPLTDAAKARQAEKSISFSEALDQVIAEQPELARVATAAGGQV